jgi:hypothetical protein
VTETFRVCRKSQDLLQRIARPPGLSLGRHEQEVAAGLEYAYHLAEEPLVVLDVLQEVDRRNHVECGGPKRQFGIAGLQHPLTDELLG